MTTAITATSHDDDPCRSPACRDGLRPDRLDPCGLLGIARASSVCGPLALRSVDGFRRAACRSGQYLPVGAIQDAERRAADRRGSSLRAALSARFEPPGRGRAGEQRLLEAGARPAAASPGVELGRPVLDLVDRLEQLLLEREERPLQARAAVQHAEDRLIHGRQADRPGDRLAVLVGQREGQRGALARPVLGASRPAWIVRAAGRADRGRPATCGPAGPPARSDRRSSSTVPNSSGGRSICQLAAALDRSRSTRSGPSGRP